MEISQSSRRVVAHKGAERKSRATNRFATELIHFSSKRFARLSRVSRDTERRDHERGKKNHAKQEAERRKEKKLRRRKWLLAPSEYKTAERERDTHNGISRGARAKCACTTAGGGRASLVARPGRDREPRAIKNIK